MKHVIKYKQGVYPNDDGLWQFNVWAPHASRVRVIVKENNEQTIDDLESVDFGFWRLNSKLGVCKKVNYKYVINDLENTFPDPCSRFQPLGVHDFSESFLNQFNWQSDVSVFPPGSNPPMSHWIIYELHVGTFTSTGDFVGAIEKLPHLLELGVTHVELMPVNSFSGHRNWGYDGVYPYSVHPDYGGPLGLKCFVDRAHQLGLCVILDVVYNHLGPEGNYLSQFGPYFTDQHTTPWGKAINFDGAYSFGVRKYFIDSAIQWLDEFRIDALRLDAVHAIYDQSCPHFLQELSESVSVYFEEKGQHKYLIAESDLSNVGMIKQISHGGMGMHAQWLDDFHHSVHSLLTHEKDGYYKDFEASKSLISCINQGFVFNQQYSKFRKTFFGSDSSKENKCKFIAFIQNHDQIGNRFFGERLSTLVSLDQNRMATLVLMLSPFVPLVFMGEEYLETNPFYYFVSHDDPHLNKAVALGRKNEFQEFGFSDYINNYPSEVETFESSKLNWSLLKDSKHLDYFSWYKDVLSLRKQFLKKGYMPFVKAHEKDNILYMQSLHNNIGFLLLVNISHEQKRIEVPEEFQQEICYTSDDFKILEPFHRTHVQLGSFNFILFEKKGFTQ